VEVYLHAFLTSALTGSESSASRRVRLTAEEKKRCPLDRRLGGPQRRSGGGGELERNPFPTPSGNRNPNVHPVAYSKLLRFHW